MDTYDSKTASRIVGVSLRQLQYWDERDFIRPSVKPAEGRGTKRLYSFHDLVCLKVVKDLAHHGFTLQKIRRCLKPLKDDTTHTERPAESLKFLTDGEELFVLTTDRRKILDAIERQFVVSLGIGSLVRELDGQVKRLARDLAPKPGRVLRKLGDKQSGSA
ncbi:MAG TPA: MerR family transcriptional regulator [Candidatus Limnocylindrales bacterium]|nr:MerR family transcriptional regulator [Candidatus Limnocylindrales bacterium]